MTRKILKTTGIIFGVLFLFIAGFYLKARISVKNRMAKQYKVSPQVLSFAPDSAAIAYGARLAKVKGCTDCHSADLGGRIFVDDPALGLLPASNLTKGQGGLPPDYNTQDWVLALKHGLRRDGTPLVFMPSHEYTFLTEQDMGALIAYCQQLPLIDRTLPAINLGPLGTILSDIGKLPLLPAEMINHYRILEKDIAAEVSVEYGRYLAIACQGCHRENMKGGEPVAPGFPEVADISSTGNVGKWTDEQFIQTLRSGITPEGKTLKPEEMPWPMAKEMTEVELKALHLYLTSL
jgi:mono/diheme cytochrome c family protein